MKQYLVITFASTYDAMAAEACCQEYGVPGRIIPLPPDIHADCGLAWRMPPEAEAAFDTALAKKAHGSGAFQTAGRYLRGFRY
ncbi:MAG: DUF3343 domain-containing protein [Lachnospiraceae bacterium]|nr:DUF3343 domain-containing protein [Lachnospiraceae bacterium]